MLNKLTGFTGVIAGILLAAAIIAFANFVLHVPEGTERFAVFFLAAVAFFALALNGTAYNRQPRP